MIDLYTTLQQFFEQFTQYVFLDVLVDDPLGEQLPRITYNFSSAEFTEQTLITFNIWSRSLNMNELYTIASRIEKVVQADGLTPVGAYSSGGYEFFNMENQTWQEIQLDEFSFWFNWHLNKGFPSDGFQWRAKEKRQIGHLELKRATPFLQSRATDERNILALYGVIIVRNYIIKE